MPEGIVGPERPPVLDGAILRVVSREAALLRQVERRRGVRGR